MTTSQRPEFTLRFAADKPPLVGARWWNQEMQTDESEHGVDRRALMALLGVGGILATTVGVGFMAMKAGGGGADEGVDMDALALQKEKGWNVGSTGTLRFEGATSNDATGGEGWRAAMDDLVTRLRPTDARLLPHYVPTLFQVLTHAWSSGLRQVITPVHTSAMDEAFRRGEGLLRQFEQVQWPRDVAVFLDLAGPESVAVAAALSPAFEPVFTFDNWPHPLGVVPSHVTLAATLFHVLRFTETSKTRRSPAAPVFVLDSARLNPYTDAPDRFDNRYVAKVPSAERLKELGIQRVLYVRPMGSSPQELDDLNEDFVAYERRGIQVRAIGLDDFQRQAETRHGGAAGVYHYGGQPHILFWPHYGWHSTAVRAPAQVSPAHAYRPATRPTIFTGRTVGGGAGVGRQKPSGFGRVSYRSGGPGRSGSFGRSRSYGFG